MPFGRRPSRSSRDFEIKSARGRRRYSSALVAGRTRRRGRGMHLWIPISLVFASGLGVAAYFTFGSGSVHTAKRATDAGVDERQAPVREARRSERGDSGGDRNASKPHRRCALVPGRHYIRGSSRRGRVAVTFDDGPSEYTPRVLDVLGKHKARATFFVLGQEIARKPDRISRIANAGHEIGNHTYGHPSLTGLSESARIQEIRRTQKQLEILGDRAPCILRPPFGSVDSEVLNTLRKTGFASIGWSVETSDYLKPSPDDMSHEVLSNVEPGSIVLMHDGGGDRSSTVKALPSILNGLQHKGLEPVTITELIAGPRPERTVRGSVVARTL